jgi:hypothetical protein
LEALEKLMFNKYSHVAVVPICWSRFLPQYAGDRVPRWLSRLKAEKTSVNRKRIKTGPKGRSKPEILSKLNAAPVEKRGALLQNFLMEQTIKVLGLDSGSQIDVQKPLNDQGLDSLMAVELSNVSAKELNSGTGLAQTLIFDYPTIEDMTIYLAGEAGIDIVVYDNLSMPEETTGARDLLDRIEGLSNTEVDRLMKEKSGG